MLPAGGVTGGSAEWRSDNESPGRQSLCGSMVQRTGNEDISSRESRPVSVATSKKSSQTAGVEGFDEGRKKVQRPVSQGAGQLSSMDYGRKKYISG